MHFVSQYIERELLAQRPICLPYIGTLSVVRRSAELSSDGGFMSAPYDELQLDTSVYVQTRSLPELLTSTDTYNQWYYSCLDASSAMLYIEGVCAIDLTSLTVSVDDAFAQILSPNAGDEMVAIGRSRAEIIPVGEVVQASRRTARRKGYSSWALTVSLLLVICALIYIGYTLSLP